MTSQNDGLSSQPQGVPPQQPNANSPQPIPVQPAAPIPIPAQPVAAQPVPIQPVPVQPVPVQPSVPQPVAGQPVVPQPVPVQPAVPQPIPAQPVPIQPNSHQPVNPAVPVTNQPAPLSSQPVPIGAQPVSPVPMTGAAAPVPLSAQVATPQPVPASAGGTYAMREASEEDEELEDRPPVAVKQAPPWLISAIIHAVVLVVAALIGLHTLGFFDKEVEPLEIEVVMAEEIGVQLEDALLQMDVMEPMDVSEPAFSEDLIAVDDPLAAPPDLPEVDFTPTAATSDLVAPSVGIALSGREKGMKKALLGAYGGNATTEAAVEAGLAWLKKNQQGDGSWSLKGPYTDGGMAENRASATAMALLAFQGAGHTHVDGEHREVVKRGWDALLKMQNAEGEFTSSNSPTHHRLYTHAQGAIAICELYGMTQDSKYRAAAQNAIKFALAAQSPEGGWRYAPKGASDTSVTGWYVMALQSALMAGLEVPSPKLLDIGKFLDTVTPDGGIHYGYQPGRRESSAMTAEGLLCRQYLGWKHDDPRLVEGVTEVSNNPVSMSDQNVYYWYYATQATHHMEGDIWNRWNRVMRNSIPQAQVKKGNEKGSWEFERDPWSGHGGRLYTTCLCIYMLEVYYRHLPIYNYRM